MDNPTSTRPTGEGPADPPPDEIVKQLLALPLDGQLRVAASIAVELAGDQAAVKFAAAIRCRAQRLLELDGDDQ